MSSPAARISFAPPNYARSWLPSTPALEAEIGHRFRNDLSMAEIIATAEQAATAEHTEETATIELGKGQLRWPRFERLTDRYGTVFLLASPDAEDYVSFENAPVGQPGRLVAVVVETRRSGHCGDIARSLAPVTSSVGEEITLGAGTLFTDSDADLGVPTVVGLAPDDHRDTDWLDPLLFGTYTRLTGRGDHGSAWCCTRSTSSVFC